MTFKLLLVCCYTVYFPDCDLHIHLNVPSVRTLFGHYAAILVFFFWKSTKSPACCIFGALSENTQKTPNLIEVYGKAQVTRTKTTGTLCCGQTSAGSVRHPSFMSSSAVSFYVITSYLYNTILFFSVNKVKRVQPNWLGIKQFKTWQ